MTTRSGGPRAALPGSSRRLLASPFILICAVCLLRSLVVPAAAQKPELRKDYALIFGTVWSPNDQPVYGVKVKMRRADKKHAQWELYSDHQGEFAQRVPAQAADYVIWVDANDLKQFKSSDGRQLQPGTEVTVHVSGNERQDVGVHLK